MVKATERGENGFTLVELLLVVAIISIIAAAALPSLLRSRMSANEAVAIGACKSIVGAQIDYNSNSKPHTFTASFACLGSGKGAGGIPFIDGTISSGLKAGYTFTLISGASVNSNSWYAWSAAARPISYRNTGVRSFYIDMSGVIRGSDMGGGFGTLNMPPFDK